MTGGGNGGSIMSESYPFPLPPTRFHPGMSAEEASEGFLENLQALGVKGHRVDSGHLQPIMQKRIEARGIRSVLFWDDAQLDELGVPRLLEGLKAERRLEWIRKWGEGSEGDLRRIAAQAELGITMVDIGVAETGSLMLLNGKGRGRLVSLTPPLLFAILSERHIVPRLTQSLTYVKALIPHGLPSCINWITGPSRTADIEGDLSIGVHGPGEVELFLLRS